MAVTASYLVSGMTCEHCVSAVSEHVRGIDGVTEARIDLASGRLVVISDADVAPRVVESAVRDAGYAAVPA